MKAFFKKLDQMAERWVDTLDGELHEPVVRIVTGEVFAHGASVEQSNGQDQTTYRAQVDEPAGPGGAIRETVAECINPPLAMPKAGASLLAT